MTTTTNDAPAPDSGPIAWHPRRWWALIPIVFAVFMDMVDNQIVAVALPSIQRDMSAAGSQLEWIASGYTLAFALTLIIGGRLGDRFGHKTLFVIGCIGFTATSALAGLAPTVDLLIAARIVQGVSAGLMIPQVLAFIQTEFPREERGKAFGLYGIMFPIGGAAGPVLGGVLSQADLFGWGWRTIFLINIPVGVLTILAAVALVPRRTGSPTVRVDLLGTLLLALPLVAVLYPLVEGWTHGWPAWTFVSMIATIPLFVLFLLQQRARAKRGREPLIRPRLFTRHMASGLVVAICLFSGMAVFFVLSLYLQGPLGYSPLKTGLSFLAATLGIVAGNGVARGPGRNAGRGLVSLAILIGAVGTGALIGALQLAGDELQPWHLIPGAIVFGLGLGMVTGTLVTVILAKVAAEDAGSASGLVNTTLQVGTAAGIALLGTIYLSTLHGGATGLDAVRVTLLTSIGLFAGALVLARFLPARSS